MAIVYSRKCDGVHYEIRSAGRSLRLYTDGIMHTQYHPQRRVTGGYWDLMALPAVALPEVRRALVLGVGGGAVLHLLRDWCPGVQVTGLELNPVHLHLAEHYFDLQGSDITLIECDAREWAEQYQDEPFDLVVEDLFSGNWRNPRRTFTADHEWCSTLDRLVSDRGALTINTLSRRELRDSAFVSDPRIRSQWQSQLCLTLPAYANHVGVFCRQPLTPGALRKAVRTDALRLKQEGDGQLRYSISARL